MGGTISGGGPLMMTTALALRESLALERVGLAHSV